MLAQVQAQQQVTDWPARLFWTAVTLALVAGIAALMLRGWRSRAARQGDLPRLPEVPADLGAELASAEGIYVSTTTEGDWLDRVVVHGLGVRSRCVLTVGEAGVLYARVGAPDVFVPRPAVRGVRLERGMAGKFVEEEGIVVLTWQHGPRSLDTGFRSRRAADRDALVAAVDRIGARGSR